MYFLHKSFPRAILHIDGDAFFASCEVALNPKLRGKPVVTGKERGIASAMTYEAKRKGVTRGMTISEIKKVCPDAIILPSDYETYSLFSQRMYSIVRRYTPEVEEYSIDECFADLTGLRRVHRASYGQIAARIKEDLEKELGMTFSIGVAPTKVLAKVASKWNKPAGLTIIPGKQIHTFLAALPIEKVWGIGPSTASFLWKQGIKTAFDFAAKSETWVKEKLSKPHLESWYELRGTSVYDLNPREGQDQQSISKTRTFTPPSNDRHFVFSQLSKNIENACIKARRHGLVARELSFFLKTQDFHYKAIDLKLTTSVAVPQVIVDMVKEHFMQIFDPKILYRATGVALRHLSPVEHNQLDLFGQTVKVDKLSSVYEVVDRLAHRFGKHTLFLASSMRAMKEPQHKGARGGTTERRKLQWKGETERRRLAIPLLKYDI